MPGLQDFAVATGQAIARALPGVNLTYRLYVAVEFKTTTGVQEATYHDVAVRSALQDTVSVRDVASSHGVLQAGDLKLRFPRSELAAHLAKAQSGDLSTSDLIVIGLTTYRVLAFDTTGNGTIQKVYARRQP